MSEGGGVSLTVIERPGRSCLVCGLVLLPGEQVLYIARTDEHLCLECPEELLALAWSIRPTGSA